MKNKYFALFFVTGLMAVVTSAARGSDLDEIAGSWSASKTNATGASYKQTLEFKKDHFVFQILDNSGGTVLYADGKVKVDRAGDLRVAKLTDIQYGKSKDDLQSADDDRTDIFTVRDDKLILATNFDKERDSQEPQTETYVKVIAKAPAADTAKPKDSK
jgi:hypothetical protein